VGFVVEKFTLEQVFSKYFGFPCQTSYSPEAGTIGLLVAAVQIGPILTPPPTMRIKKKVDVFWFAEYMEFTYIIC
jgi:hypothetical protein